MFNNIGAGIVLVAAVVGVNGRAVSGVKEVFLAPVNDINLPASESAKHPLTNLGANGPWSAGPKISGESNDVPDGCTVENVAYVVRHGSRYPDPGAYSGWVDLYTKIQAANFTATGSLAFLPNWKPVLTNSALQIAKESPTGYKEAFDLGYQLRTKYPDLYDYGTPFISWANLVPRVVETAQNFVRGFLGAQATTLGSVITVNSTGSPKAIFDSLGPSDMCPNFIDGNGGTNLTTWQSIYLPPITSRLNALTTGSLNLTTSDVSSFPYLCGFESQITGRLSPFCSVFTDEELRQYEFAQDLRYYYGMGDGMDLPSKMMLPFLNSLVDRMAKGPNQNGTTANGGSFKVPNILTAFLNDGQITELVAATGVMSDAKVLDGNAIPRHDWKYQASRFVTMRGTVAFERLSCVVPASNSVAAVKRSANSTLSGNTTAVDSPTPSSSSVPVPVWGRPYTNGTVPGTGSNSGSGSGSGSNSGSNSGLNYGSNSGSDSGTGSGSNSGSGSGSGSNSGSGSGTDSGSNSGSGSGSGSNSGFNPGSSYGSNSGSGSGTDSGSNSGSDSGPTGSGLNNGSGSSSNQSGLGSGSSGSDSEAGSSSNVSGPGTSNPTSDSDPSLPPSSGSSSPTVSTGSGTSTPSTGSGSPSSTPSTGPQTNPTTTKTYIRILLNDAVYPVPSCHDGPGKSCLLSTYASITSKKLTAAGNLRSRCNITASVAAANGNGTSGKGASFFGDLGGAWLGTVVP